jgi:O-antigen ligase
MTSSIKELIVVSFIAAIIFSLARRVALLFTNEEDFKRRRNIWFALTITAFLSPSFWLYVLVAIPLMIWGGRKDSNPVAFYLLLLQVIPSIPVDIPVVGINHLFYLDNYRLLAFCVLMPTAWRLRRSDNPSQIRGIQSMDFMLLAYGVLETAIFIPPDLPGHVLLHDSPTNMLRRGCLFLLDVYLLYYVVSRFCVSRRIIVEAIATFCLACGVMAALAIFETAKHWLLYADFAVGWSDDPTLGFYLIRGESLRAQASSGHALALGYMLATAFGFWLYLKSRIDSKRASIAVALLLWLGLLGAYSRGPWIGAVAIYFTFVALSQRGFSKLFRATGVVILLAGAISVTPLGPRVATMLPFLGGSVDSGTLEYRERLAQRSWDLIKAHPFLGDHLAIFQMEDLRQGQGIIDVVNTYAGVTLNKGFVGLALFLLFILIALVKAYRATKNAARSDPDLALLGLSLVACVVGTLLMIENASFYLAYEKMFYILAGLSAAYAHLRPSTEGAVEPKARIAGHWGPA